MHYTIMWREDEGATLMMEMRWWNWMGLAMMVIVIVLFSYEPIWQFVSSDTENIQWVVVYIFVAALLLIRGDPDRGKP